MPVSPAPIVFFDIAGPDQARQSEFYRKVLGWEARPDGRLAVPVASPLPGLLRVEAAGVDPQIERVLYAGVPDIEATLQLVVASGGQVVFPRMEIPGTVVVAMFTDPAGNRVGLVKMAGTAVKVPPT
jgi:uncharacterized protein